MPPPFLAVIVPAYNEASRMGRTLARLQEYFAAQEYTWTITVVSDGSTDETNQIVEEFAKGNSGFSLRSYSPNHGKGYAVRLGMLEIAGELKLFSDADLAAPIEELEKLLMVMSEGADIAIGSRPLKESNLEIRQPFHREMMGRLFNKAVQLLAIKGIQDTQCGFKVFRETVAEDVFSRCTLDGFSFDFEALMIAKDLGYKISEVPIRWRHQEGSKVRLLRDGSRMLIDLVRLRLRGKRNRMAARAN